MYAESRIVAHNVDTEIIFARRGIARWMRKFWMYGPYILWLSSQSRQPELAFRNSHEASKRNGVVGSTGRNIPSEASPIQVKAMMFKMIFIIKCQ